MAVTPLAPEISSNPSQDPHDLRALGLLSRINDRSCQTSQDPSTGLAQSLAAEGARMLLAEYCTPDVKSIGLVLLALTYQLDRIATALERRERRP